ncbi:MAG: hypothetical protein QOJ51_4145 [Acidobacteriaceae bacterium]|jgi:hypothetical protein|nr:hypothetical protein [Acidobacteriaceae bacterium]
MVSTVRWSCIGRVTSHLDFSTVPCKTAAIDAQRYQFATKNSNRGAEIVGDQPKSFPCRGYSPEGTAKDSAETTGRIDPAVNLRTRTG